MLSLAGLLYGILNYGEKSTGNPVENFLCPDSCQESYYLLQLLGEYRNCSAGQFRAGIMTAQTP